MRGMNENPFQYTPPPEYPEPTPPEAVRDELAKQPLDEHSSEAI